MLIGSPPAAPQVAAQAQDGTGSLLAAGSLSDIWHPPESPVTDVEANASTSYDETASYAAAAIDMVGGEELAPDTRFDTGSGWGDAAVGVSTAGSAAVTIAAIGAPMVTGYVFHGAVIAHGLNELQVGGLARTHAWL